MAVPAKTPKPWSFERLRMILGSPDGLGMQRSGYHRNPAKRGGANR
jgi:hypothetical protein